MATRDARLQQAQALRRLADELEAGTLPPMLAKKLDQVLEAAIEEEEGHEELSPEEHERVWTEELEGRIAERAAGKDEPMDGGAFLRELRARLLA